MAEQSPRRSGNPAWVKGGPSPNPKGRPRTGLALAERIRERVSPDLLIDLVSEAVNDDTIPLRDRLSYAFQLATLGYQKPASGLDLNVHSQSSAAGDVDWSKVPLDARREELERRRAFRERFATDHALVEPVFDDTDRDSASADGQPVDVSAATTPNDQQSSTDTTTTNA